MNPHVYIYIDEKSEDGKVVNWGFEGYPPNTLRRVGLARDMLKVGDSVTVTGWGSKDGSLRFAAREITWPDGRSGVSCEEIFLLRGDYDQPVHRVRHGCRAGRSAGGVQTIPRAEDGKPDLSGIWQALGVSLTGETPAPPAGGSGKAGAGR